MKTKELIQALLDCDVEKEIYIQYPCLVWKEKRFCVSDKASQFNLAEFSDEIVIGID